MQQLEAGIKQTLEAIYPELTAKPELAAGAQNFVRNLVPLVRWVFWDGLQMIELIAIGA